MACGKVDKETSNDKASDKAKVRHIFSYIYTGIEGVMPTLYMEHWEEWCFAILTFVHCNKRLDEAKVFN